MDMNEKLEIVRKEVERVEKVSKAIDDMNNVIWDAEWKFNDFYDDVFKDKLLVVAELKNMHRAFTELRDAIDELMGCVKEEARYKINELLGLGFMG